MTGTKVCVIGWPISHSRSPLIHGHWLDQYDIDGIYERLPVEPGNLGMFLERVSSGELAGANVTIPHKESVFRLIEKTDPVARTLKAVNTIYIDNGQLAATNTDGYGFLANLKEGCPQWSPSGGPATILGAGGAARAIIYALLDAGVPEIRIVNRNIERARLLAADLCPDARIAPWDAVDSLLPNTHLLVNTTSLGMVGMPNLIIDSDLLPDDAIVTDIVYTPLRTKLLLAAGKRGLPTVDGLGMLLHQAVPGFEKWFGVRPDVTSSLRTLLIRDIEKS